MKTSSFRAIISVLLACVFVFATQAQSTVVDVACDSVALVAAINAANGTPEADTLNLTADCVYSFTSAADIDDTIGETNIGHSALPRITTPLTINGNGATLQRDDNAPDFRLMRVETSGSLSLNNLTITGGEGVPGAGVFNFGLLNLITVVMSDNNAGRGSGGAIANVTEGIIRVKTSIFSGNSAYGGGGIANNGNVVILESVFSGNVAIPDEIEDFSANGGGILNYGGNLVILESVFSGNVASIGDIEDYYPSGGGIWIHSGHVDIFNSVISGNTSHVYGGGILKVGDGALNIVNSVLSGNHALNGGALYAGAGIVTITNSTISGNSADEEGGAISAYESFDLEGIYLYNNIIWGNSTQTSGTGIVASNNIIEGGYTGTGNLDADPLFVSPVSHTLAPTTAGDYRVQANSPALNHGNNSMIPVDQYDLDGNADTDEAVPYDLDGNPRVVNGTVDTGAYEHQTVAAVVLSKDTVSLAEGGATGTYTVVLASIKPTASVTITPYDDNQCTVSAALTFTTDNWNTPQEITVTAIDDATAEGDHPCTITHAAVSSDTIYNGIDVTNVTGNISDNDVSGVNVQPTTIDVAEGGATGVYSIALKSQPTADVTVTPSGDSQCTVSVPLMFTTDNWNTSQEITVTAIDDAIAEGEHTCTITHAAASSDTIYDSIDVTNVTGNITDDDPFAVELLVNGGFETNEDEDKIPDGWTIAKNTSDKLVCKPDKVHAGNCAFKFKGSLLEKAVLMQNVDLTGTAVDSGDALDLSAYFKATNTAAKAKLILTISYTGVSSPVAFKAVIKQNAAYTVMSLPAVEITDFVETVTVKIKHKSKTGVMWIDDVSLIHTPAMSRRSEVLPIPSAPEGFRGNN